MSDYANITQGSGGYGDVGRWWRCRDTVAIFIGVTRGGRLPRTILILEPEFTVSYCIQSLNERKPSL